MPKVTQHTVAELGQGLCPPVSSGLELRWCCMGRRDLGRWARVPDNLRWTRRASPEAVWKLLWFEMGEAEP